MSRPIEEITKDFEAELAKAGHIYLQISYLQGDLDRVSARMRALNEEGNAAQKEAVVVRIDEAKNES